MKFPFYDAPNTATITCCHILENGEPILYVSHDEDDGMWQFLCGKAHETDEAKLVSINEQISNFAQTYPTNLKASSNEALLFMRRYRFANCSCFSCCFKDAYPSSNVQ